MKQYLLFFLLFLYGCNPIRKDKDLKWKTIEIGDFLFDFPSDFKLVKDKGVDSNVGRVVGDSLVFNYDFGYYSSQLTKTPKDCLDSNLITYHAGEKFTKPGIIYDKNNWPKVRLLKLRQATIHDSTLGQGCDYVAICEYKKQKFDYPIFLAVETKNKIFIIDTLDNIYRKIVYPQKYEPNNVIGVHVHKLTGYNQNINNYLGLTLTAATVSREQQELVLQIIGTMRAKPVN